MNLTVPQYTSRQFSWTGNNGAAFLTDLAGRGQLHGRLYDDAEDRGFIVHSMKTGAAITFVLAEVTRGDPCEFIFHSIDGRGKTGKIKIRILNT
jgi:hypothetical protein